MSVSFSSSSLHIDARSTHGVVRLRIAGESLAPNLPEGLESFFDNVFESRPDESAFELHFEELLAVSSELLGFLISIVGRTLDTSIPVAFFYDARRPFQQALFSGLQPLLADHPQARFEQVQSK